MKQETPTPLYSGNSIEQGSKKLNIWLDDERPMIDPDMDLHCRTAEEVIELIKQNKVAFVSLDNDLGSGYTEGKKVAQFIEQAYGNKEIEFVDFHPHTANPVAWDEIMKCKRSVHKMLNSQLCNPTPFNSSKEIEQLNRMLIDTLHEILTKEKRQINEIYKLATDALQKSETYLTDKWEQLNQS